MKTMVKSYTLPYLNHLLIHVATGQAPSPMNDEQKAAAYATSSRGKTDIKLDQLFGTTLTSCGGRLSEYFDKQVAVMSNLSSMNFDIPDVLTNAFFRHGLPENLRIAAATFQLPRGAFLPDIVRRHFLATLGAVRTANSVSDPSLLGTVASSSSPQTETTFRDEEDDETIDERPAVGKRKRASATKPKATITKRGGRANSTMPKREVRSTRDEVQVTFYSVLVSM